MFATRWIPLHDIRDEMNRLQGEMNRMFSRGAPTTESCGAVCPPLNVWEDAGHLFVEAELPGFALEDLEIHVTPERQLTIKGERKKPVLENVTWHRQERGYGTFSRVLELPAEIAVDQVEASFKNGVLAITLPKRPETQPRKIVVKCS